jgi:nucleotide-binding universal stress UspA family protein
MAMSQKERSAKAARKRSAAGVEEIRHRIHPGIKAMLLDLMDWHDLAQAEAIDLLIITAHAAGPDESGKHLVVPHHKFEISETLRETFDNESRKELRRDPGDQTFVSYRNS